MSKQEQATQPETQTTGQGSAEEPRLPYTPPFIEHEDELESLILACGVARDPPS